MKGWAAHQASICPSSAAVARWFHVLWSGPLTESVFITLASFRQTQLDYDAKMTLWIYGSGDMEEAVASVRQDWRWERLMQLGGAPVELRPLGSAQVATMAEGSLWEGGAQAAWRGFLLQDGSASVAALSDFLRLFVLERLGGVYVDADVLFLASWRPLLCGFGGDFAYEWGPEGYMNTAVLSLSRGSPLGPCLLQAAASGPQASLPNPFHPGELSRLAHEQCADGLAMLPCEMFDPYWPFHYGRAGAALPPWLEPQAPPAEAFRRLCLAGGRRPAGEALGELRASGALASHLHAGACAAAEAGSWLRAAFDYFYAVE